jgi:hypothetical protein
VKRSNPEAEKELTILAINISGVDVYKPIAPGIVYIPTESIQGIDGKKEPMCMHICKPAKFITKLREARTGQGVGYEINYIWKQNCGIIFSTGAKVMHCSKCFIEFDESLYSKLTILGMAGKLNL